MPDSSSTRDRLAARLAWALVGLGALAGVAYVAIPSLCVQAAVYGAAGAGALLAGIGAVARRREAARLGWLLLLASAGLWLAGDTLWTSFEAAGTHTSFPAPIDLIYLAGYPLAIVGVVLVWRRATTGVLGGILDASIAATGIGVFTWAALIDTGTDAEEHPLVLLAATAYPTFDILLLVALAQLLLAPRLRGNLALRALVAGAGIFLVTDLFYAQAAVLGTYEDGGLADLGWLACYVLWGAAAVHPSARGLVAGPTHEVRLTSARLAGLAAACLFAPASLVVATHDGPADLTVFTVSGSLLIALVFGRMALIFREERRGADELRRSRELYRALVEKSRDMVALVDSDDRVVFASPAHERVLALDPEELIGTHAGDLVHPDDREQAIESLAAVLEGRRVTAPPFRLVRADGQVVWAETTASVLETRADGTELVLTSTRDVTERLRAETELAETTRKLQTLVDTAPVGILSVDRDGLVTMWNPGAERMFGWTAEEVIGGPTPLLDEAAFRRMMDRLHAVESIEEEGVRPHKDGHDVQVIAQAVLLRDSAGTPAGAFAVFVDVSARHRLEEQLRQAQKMEAVGQLAGGIAHDFNNLLTGISGYTELALDRLGDDAPVRRELVEVARASERAAELTRQLLAFGRRQMLQASVFDLNDAVVQTTGLLGRVLGEHIRIVASLDPAGCFVRADQNQIVQVLMNLAVNARDAQPDGGTLALETENVTLGAGAAPQELPPGPYVRLRVSDTGQGMDAETAKHAFEPFYTTKETGKGTGLGLATVYGVVTQSGGTIELSTEPGTGTTFEILLPRTSRPAGTPGSRERAESPGGGERILLVEDEPIVRALTRELLEARGYSVAEASSPEEALALAVREPVDLLLTDVVMPGMNGRRLAASLRRDRPSLPVVYTSGYSDDAALREGSLEPGARFLQKPYTGDDLARAIRACLEAAQPSSSSASSSAATTS